MPRKSPFVIKLTAEEERILAKIARKYTSPYFLVVRARAILHAAEGLGNDDIATRLDTRRQTVSRWRRRFYEAGLPALIGRPRRGRLRRASPQLRVPAVSLLDTSPTPSAGSLSS